MKRGGRVNQTSARRRSENEIRRQVVADIRLNRGPYCQWPYGCTRIGCDPHEIRTRARGGSITDPDNIVLLCRQHHDHITHTAEGQREGHELGLLKHSWEA